MTPWLLILAGLVVLLVGAELLVRGSAWIAEALGVRPMIVGLTVVAIGTSAPELVVSIIGAVDSKIDLVLGNVYGSNIANIGMILGVTALIKPIHAGEGKIRFELFWLLFASLLTLIPFATGSFDVTLGFAMVGFLALFVYWLVKRELHMHPRRLTPQPRVAGARPLVLHIAIIPVGLAGLVFGGEMLVDGAVQVARRLNLGDGVIGATVIAIGTSLPELATSVVAARKGHPELAIGNIIGSNLFNILMVLGVTATIHPLPVVWEEQWMRTLSSLVLTVYLAILLLGSKSLGRTAGGVLLISYIAYLAAEVIRA